MKRFIDREKGKGDGNVGKTKCFISYVIYIYI